MLDRANSIEISLVNLSWLNLMLMKLLMKIQTLMAHSFGLKKNFPAR